MREVTALISAAIISTLALPVSAFAGARIENTGASGVVIINGNQAIASIGKTRNSVDPDEIILLLDRGSSIFISAKDENRNVLSCNTTDSRHMQVIRGLTDSSVIDFQVRPDGSCSIVKSTKGSHLLPKLPF